MTSFVACKPLITRILITIHMAGDERSSANTGPRIISAGDLEKYSYCPLSWWLSIGIKDPASESAGADTGKNVLKKGIQKHRELGKELTSIQMEESLAKKSETVVLWFAITATLLSVVGLSLVFEAEPDVGLLLGVMALIWILAACYFLYLAETIATKKQQLVYQRIILIFAIVGAVIGVNSLTILSEFFDPDIAQIMQALSLLWLIAASFFLYRSLKHVKFAHVKRRKTGVRGKLSYVDTEEARPKLFLSLKHGLSGRPDYVLVAGEEHIPVEAKTGRTPRGPLFSHIMQVAAYCLLMEEEYGRAPPHGILRYPETEHEIDYDEALKQLVIDKLSEMRRVLDGRAEAHRNHNKPGKCKHCSRRDMCPERLD